MNQQKLETMHAPAERADETTLKQQIRSVSENSVVSKILDAVPEAVLILNQQRQIVFINKASMEVFGVDQSEMLCGLRPGEALSCANSELTEGGCGTSDFCRYCGAVNAILNSQQDETVIDECRITNAKDKTALDLKIKAAPYEDQGEKYTIFSILDISSDKKKEILQRVFFHDIMNTAGGLSGYSELLLTDDIENQNLYKEMIFELSQRLIDEINSQRQIYDAEQGILTISKETFNTVDLVDKIIGTYQNRITSQKITISKVDDFTSVAVESDMVLLSRILVNLIKNAVEASKENDTVWINSKPENDSVVISVNNAAVMSDEVKMQMFQRSFSTKGKGRGLGSYSVKLFMERFLGGSVWFTSVEKEGTTFFIKLPLILKEEEQK